MNRLDVLGCLFSLFFQSPFITLFIHCMILFIEKLCTRFT